MHPKQQHIIDVYGKEPSTLDEIAEAFIAVISLGCQAPVVGFAWDIRYCREVSNSHNAPLSGYTNWGGRKSNGVRSYPGFSGRVWIRHAIDPNFMSFSDTFRKTLSYPGTGGGGSYNGPWTEICTAVYKTIERTRSDNLSERTRSDKLTCKYSQPKCYSWDYKMFVDDFPWLNRNIIDEIYAHELQEDKNEVWAKVNSNFYKRTRFILRHNFHWEEPETKAADDAFLKEYNKSLEKETI